MIRAALGAGALALLAMTSACGNDAAEPASEVVAGSDNTYRADMFGMTVTAPDGWYVAPSDVMDKMMASGQDIATSRMDETTQAMIDGSVARTVNLFTFTEYPPGAPVESSSAILGIAEDVSIMPGIERGRDYFFHARKLMEQSPIPTEIAEEYGERTIGGHVFDRMDVVMGGPERQVRQNYYAARHGDHIVALIASYGTDEQRAALDEVIDSITLDW